MRWLGAFLAAFFLAGVAYGQPFILRNRDLGVIFNTDNLFFDLESYQGGVGIKLAGEDLTYRAIVDMYTSTVADASSFGVGVGVEYHFEQGRVSPFAGGLLSSFYTRAEDGSTSDLVISSRTFEIALGGLFGVEVYLTRFLSLFVEYDLSLTYDSTKITEELAGEKTSEYTRDWTFDLGIGNQSKLGVVFYFYRDRNFPLKPIRHTGSE